MRTFKCECSDRDCRAHLTIEEFSHDRFKLDIHNDPDGTGILLSATTFQAVADAVTRVLIPEQPTHQPGNADGNIEPR